MHFGAALFVVVSLCACVSQVTSIPGRWEQLVLFEGKVVNLADVGFSPVHVHSLVFGVQACEELIITFSEVLDNSKGYVMVYIGYQQNNYTLLIPSTHCDEDGKCTPTDYIDGNFLDCDNAKYFWMKWDNHGILELGNGWLIGQDLILHTNYSGEFNLNSVTFRVNHPHGGVAVINIDTRPEFISPSADGTHNIVVDETAEIGMNIFTLEAEDPENDNITYSVVGDYIDMFNISGNKLYNTEPLNFEARCAYDVTISASDMAGEVNTTLTIRVGDVIDEPPQLIVTPVSIPEELAVGTAIDGGFLVRDQDKNDTESLTLSGPHSDYFKVLEDWKFEIMKRIDYENGSPFLDQLVLTAVDSAGLNTSAFLNITILDMNDNPPVFSSPVYYASVKEHAKDAVILTINCTDADSGANGDISITLTSGYADSNGRMFNLDSNKQEISAVSSKIDYESLSDRNYSFVLTVTAVDKPTSDIPNTAYSTVIVKVIPANDNTPIWNKAIDKFEIPETSSAGTYITTYAATDADHGSDGDITYTIESIKAGTDEAPGMFTIDSCSGNLSTSGILDSDPNTGGVPVYTVKVQAADGGNPPRSVTKEIKITVKKENDNVPKFKDSDSFAAVAEDAKVGDKVYTFTAVDDDAGESLLYTLTGDGSDVFEITNSDIVVKAALDYETKSCYSVFINATDGLHFAAKPMTISVTDAVDEKPVITVFHPLSIPEKLPKNTVLGKLYDVIDRDSNDTLAYSLSGNDKKYFTIDPVSGMLSIAQMIERSKGVTNINDLKLVATDSNSNNASATVSISITAVSTTMPNCSADVKLVNITENTPPGQLLSTITCIDAKPTDIHMTVASADDAGMFSTKDNQLQTSNTPVDYEALPDGLSTYTLMLEVADGSGPNKAIVVVVVQVSGENEYSPVWGQSSPLMVTVQEDLQPGGVITQVNATDQDAGTDGDVIFKIKETQDDTANPVRGFFNINKYTGVLTTVKALDGDRETGGVTFYNVTVVAYNSGMTPREETLNVIVSIENVNDNPPQFVNFQRQETVAENASIGAVVVNLNGSDIDALAPLTYTVVGGDTDYFRSDGAAIEVAKRLDYEKKGCYNVVINLSDGTFDVNETLIINVLDVIDEQPQITIFARAEFLEELPIGTVIGGIFRVTDPDKGDNLTYSLSGPHGKYLSIDNSTGDIRVKSRVDADSISPPFLDQLTLLVVDEAGLKDSRPLNLTIVDVDDNSPTFSKTLYKISVAENTTNGVLITLKCTDPDVGKNGEFDISVVSGDDNSVFNVSGLDLTVSGSVDYESLQAQDYTYILTLRATASAGGANPKFGVALIIVEVLPVNEFSPEWNTSITVGGGRFQDISLYENVTRGTVIGQYSATDADKGTGGILKYSVMTVISETGQLSFDKFQIDTTSGELHVIGDLDRDEATGGVAYYNVTVQVEDNGSPPFSTQGTFTVRLLNANDNAPSLNMSDSEITVLENVGRGSVFYNFTASSDIDGDSVTYSITRDASKTFGIHDGGLMLLKELDYEKETFYIVQLTMSDGTYTTTETLVVRVDDVIDESPKLVTLTPAQTLASLPVGSVISGLFTVSDADKDDHLTYNLTGNQSSYLEINNTTGEVRIRTSLSSLGSPYLDQLTLRVEDQAGLYDEKPLNITVVTAGGSAPAFSTFLYTANITENSQNVTVHTLQVTDPSQVSSGAVSISIVSGDENGVFNLSGLDLAVTGSVDYESLQRQGYKYILTLRATAAGGGDGGAAVVIIDVLPQNEFTPMWSVFDSNYTTANFSAGGKISIYENVTVGSVITILKATDADSGEDGSIRYRLISTQTGHDLGASAPFIVDATTGEVRVSGYLDRDMATGGVENYTIGIQALDGAQPPKTLNGTLTIQLLDVDDNPPAVDSSGALIRVPENIVVGFGIYTLTGDGKQFSLVGGDVDSFKLVGNRLTVGKVLDYENQTVYSVIVNADDGRSSSNITVTILVNDVIDEAPVLTILEPVTIQEELAVNTTLGGIFTVSDRDQDDTLTFSLQGSDSKYLRLNPATNELQIAQRIDRDVPHRVIKLTNITLTVTDSAGLTTNRTFSVDIINIDDNPPVFSQVYYYATVDENSTKANIVNLSVSDLDIAPDNNHKLKIVNGNTNSLFTLTNTVISVDGSRVDYESMPTTRNTYTLTVLTEGGTMTGTTLVVVVVQPRNEFTPTWVTAIDGQGYFPNVTVYENATVGTELTSLKANDSDMGYDGTLVYKSTITAAGGADVFSIDDRTGIVRISGTLDSDAGSGGSDVYELSVLVTDKGSPPLLVKGKLRIFVLNSNDNAPTVTSSVRSIRVAENASIGDVLVTIPTTDLDGDSVTVSVVDNSDIVQVKNSSLVLKTAVKDISGSCPTLVLRVSDGELYTDYSYILQVTSVNVDVANIKFPTSYSIPEEIPVGTVLGGFFTVISDGGSTLQFTMKEPASNFLEMDYKTGLVTVKQRLNRDGASGIKSIKGVLLSVTDNLGRVTSQSLDIDIVDINDNIPMFNKSIYSVSVKENSQDGSVLAVGCEDLDDGQNGVVVISLIGDTRGGLVSLVGPSLNVQATLLNFDTLAEDATTMTFTLEATDQSQNFPRFTSQATVIIKVEPVNEFPPFISDPAIKTQVPEDFAIGSLVWTLNATDSDRGQDGQLTYSMVSVLDDTTNSGLYKFELHPTSGELRTTDGLDTDLSTGGVKSYIVTYKVSDGGMPSKERQGQITVSLLPVNEHTPVLKASRDIFEIKEDAVMSTKLYTYSATDADGDNVTFSVSGNLFRFKGSDLTLSQKLDYQADNCKVFTVSATDGKFTTSVSFTLHVIKVNVSGVSPPKIRALSSPTILEEQPIGTVVSLFQAVDGGNPPLSYTLSGDQANYFTIDSATGVIKLAKFVNYDGQNGTKVLDRVTLTVTDSAKLQDWVTFNLAVQDLNDNSPVCKNANYRIKVQENSPKGQQLGSLDCYDDDGGEFGKFSGSIAREGVLDSFFTMSGMKILTSGTPVDYEALTPGSPNMMKIILVDNPSGNVHLTSAVFVTISILPVNEFKPEWNSTNMVVLNSFPDVTVYENVTIGTVVTAFTATDKDAGTDGIVTYTLKSLVDANGIDASSLFTLEYDTGTLRTAAMLDADKSSKGAGVYTAVVVAQDQGYVPNTVEASRRMIVINTNDNPPTLGSAEQQISIYENASVGDVIYTLSASDIDGDPVTFKVIGDLLKVSGSSFILNGSLDFERERCMTIEIIAMDEMFTVKSTIIINVLDINDETPVIQSNGPIRVLEEQPVGTVVGSVSVTDGDEGDVLTYSFVATSNLFSINSTTGQLTIKQSVDFEKSINQNDLRVDVRATDSAGHVATSTLLFIVTDINDNTPACPLQMYEVNVTENIDNGSAILRLPCTDADAGSNGQITLTITKGNEDDMFNVTGNQLIVRAPDYDVLEYKDFTYTLTVAVTDSPINEARRTAYVTVVINVQPHNEFDPYWMSPVVDSSGRFKDMTVREDIKTGSLIKTFTASDLDLGRDGKIKYSITSVISDSGKSALDLFAIDKTTGSLVTTSALDYDLTTGGSTYYNITVRADDCGMPSKSVTGVLNLALTNYNDNAPKFTQTLYTVRVGCDKSNGDSLSSLQASDEDSAVLKYAINGSSRFVYINLDTGHVILIYTPEELALPHVTSDIFVAIVSDRGKPDLRDFATVFLTFDSCNRPTVSTTTTITTTTAELKNVPLTVLNGSNTKQEDCPPLPRGQILELMVTRILCGMLGLGLGGLLIFHIKTARSKLSTASDNCPNDVPKKNQVGPKTFMERENENKKIRIEDLLTSESAGTAPIGHPKMKYDP